MDRRAIHNRRRGNPIMKKTLGVLLLATLPLGACGDLTVPDYNNPSIEDLEANPTPASVRAASTGLLIGARANITDRTGYVAMMGVLGREAYILDVSDPRYITELLVGPISSSGAFGAGLWTARYQNIRNANIVLSALDRVAGFTEPQKEAIRGFAKTIQALDFLLVINSRDTNGAPIEVGGSIDQLAEIASKQAVFAHIVSLLTQAEAHLQAGGAAFPFPLSSGFTGFNTPETFLQFNRALRARVEAYRGGYPAAIQALQGSFVSTSAPLTLGVYHTFDAGSDAPNQLNSTFFFVHPRIVQDAERRPNGEPDLRVQQKVGPHPEPTELLGIGSNLEFRLYPAVSTSVPIIRNEELILLRAEARWFTNDRAGALADLNFIRVNSGGLAPIDMLATDAEFITQLLRQRRYSLLFEGGHSLIDYRRFGRLQELPRDLPSHTFIPAFLVPEAECLARGRASVCDLS